MTHRPFKLGLVAAALAAVPACSDPSDHSNQGGSAIAGPADALDEPVDETAPSDGIEPRANVPAGDSTSNVDEPVGAKPNGPRPVAVSPSGSLEPSGDLPTPSSGEENAPAAGGGGSMMETTSTAGTPAQGPATPEGAGGFAGDSSCASGVANEVYDRYVAPLVEGGQPSSCNQCHLSGVNLGNFVQGTPCESMACLMQSGEVDLDDPTNSKILQRIELADPASGLISQPVIDREYEGFLAWIEYSAQCQETVCGDVPDACGGDASALDTPSGPLGECTEQQLADQFERSVYSTLAGRCSGCHDPDGPKFEEDAVLWLDLREGGSLRTMYNLVGLGELNTSSPELSMLLLKPLAESAGGVVHGGGDKYANTLDATYVETLRWIEAYASCKNTGDLGEFPEEPTVSIVTPQAGQVQNPLRLDAIAIDAQEGQLLDNVNWTSDRDGELGSQTTISEVNLASGDHTLTFTAQDGDGNSVEASVTVTVQASN
jgi:hypothetical protein